MVHHIPQGSNSLNVYLVVKDGNQAMKFYAKAFQGTQVHTLTTPDGNFMHGEIRIGNSSLMLSEENPNWQTRSAETMGGSPASIHLYVEDADQSFQHAIESGCTEVFPVSEMFWGDRYGKVKDPFGYEWGIATHVEDVEPEEMDRRIKEWHQQMQSAGQAADN